MVEPAVSAEPFLSEPAEKHKIVWQQQQGDGRSLTGQNVHIGTRLWAKVHQVRNM